MPFGNPVVGGNELVRNAIQNPGYVQGSSGWRIGRDGSAEFGNVQTRGTLAAGIVNADDLVVSGQDIGTYLDSLPKGAITYGSYGGPDVSTTTELGLVEIKFVAKANRLYRIFGRITGYILNVNGNMGPTVRWTNDGTVPKTTSTQLAPSYGHSTIAGFGAAMPFEFMVGWDHNVDYTIRLLLGFAWYAGSGNAAHCTFGRIDVADVGSWENYNDLGVANNGGGGATAPVSKYDDVYYYTSVQTYDEFGNPSIANNASVVGYQGDGTAVGNPGGNSIGAFFFNSAAFRSALAGATILNSYIYLANAHSYYNSGLTAIIGTHNADPTPGSATGLVATQNRWQMQMAEGAVAWTADLGVNLGQWMRDGLVRGITVGYAPTTDIGYYGYFNDCRIQIVYQK